MPSSLPRTLTPRQLLRISIVVALVTMLLKAGAWWFTQSVGLLSDAMESVVNLAGASFALAMVTIARRPADTGHPYGHSKAEYFSAGFEGLLVMLAALGIAWAAVDRLLHPQALNLGWSMGLSVLGSALNGGLAWMMLRSARVYRSAALEGDARHLISDVWTSAGILVGVALVGLTGWGWLDPATALVVAVHILYVGARLVWASSQGLMDEALEPEVLEQVRQVLAGFAQPNLRFDDITSRRAGACRFVELHLHMPPEWSLGRAAALRGAVERALMDRVPGLQASVLMLPMNMESTPTPPLEEEE